jgi:hypothetical protein
MQTASNRGQVGGPDRRQAPLKKQLFAVMAEKRQVCVE